MSETTFHLINESIRSNAIQAVKDTPLGKIVQIQNKGKTSSQRSYFHKLVQLISQHTGETKDRAKHLIKEKVLGKDEWVDKKGVRHERVVSSEELDVEMYGKLIDYAIIVCDYLNIAYPDCKQYGVER
jgi:hypothetical protein